MKTDTIRFHYRGVTRQLTEQDTTRTVLQYLREDLGCIGTKEGCAEGDCGACTVILAELGADGKVELRAVNSCIQFLPVLDGKALFTVEDLQQPDGQLHPVQQSLVDNHGSQCGFCTPGFVMSLWGMYLTHGPEQLNRLAIDDALSGNLCRCTGYRPIIRAAEQMFNYPPVSFDTERLKHLLEQLQRQQTFTYEHDGHIFHAPRSLAMLAELYQQYPAARLLAGGTDIGLWVTKQYRDLNHLIYIGQVAELHEIKQGANYLYIGAAVLLNQAFAALMVQYPQLAELRQRFASYPIRNAGTLGGNVANGSPIGDSMPALLALRTLIILRQGKKVREMPLVDFYLAYQQNALQGGEFVQGLRIPVNNGQTQFRTYKLSKRFDQDISAVCAAFAIQLDDQSQVQEIHTGFGGVAAIPTPARKFEASLRGKKWSEDNLQQALEVLADEFQPLTDMRASSAYRIQAIRNLAYRFFLETRPDNPLNSQQINTVAYASQY